MAPRNSRAPRLCRAALAVASLVGAACSSGGGTGSGGATASGGQTGTGSGGTTGSGGQTGTGSGGMVGSSGGATGSGGAAGGARTGGMTGGAVGGGSSGRGGAGATSGGSSGAAGSGMGGAGAVAFETRVLSSVQVAEGADVGDIDGDGVLDLVAGPVWYRGPTFAPGGTIIANPPMPPMDQYSTFFLTFVGDLNGDNRPDVIAIGDAGIAVAGVGAGNARWYENPGPASLAQPWPMHPLFGDLVSNESPAYVDLVGDATRELVFMTNRQLGYAQPGATPTAPWVFHAISTGVFNTPYVHGLGVGDVDGDGLADVLERTGWWRQVPAAGGAAPTWEQHTADFGAGANKSFANWGGSEMYVADLDGDGDGDVVTALAAHQYGLSWFEQQRAGATISFVPHVIMPAAASAAGVLPGAAAYSFSQLHAVVMADLNGDGLPDFITGKRYYAHPSTNPDPGTTDPPVIEWFELRRSGGAPSFVPHLIHDGSGVGCNFVARDLNGDGKLDVFATNKHGTFVHLQR